MSPSATRKRKVPIHDKKTKVALCDKGGRLPNIREDRYPRQSPSVTSDTSGHNRRTHDARLPMEFRQGEFRSGGYIRDAELFAEAGYISVDFARQMQQQGRQYYLTDIRKGNKERKTLRDIRLIMGIFDLFVNQKDGERPKYAEITIPG